MLRGLYTSAHGMRVQSKLNDITANNMANTNTIGFKRDVGVVSSFPDMLLYRMEAHNKKENPSHMPPRVGFLSTGVIVHEAVASIREEGNLMETNNPLDLAILGEGFFVVSYSDLQGAAGERYTRQGNFRLNQGGQLVTVDGNPVLGQNGHIFIPEGKILIDVNGNISVDEQFIDRLRIVSIPDDEQVDKHGYTYITSQNPGVAVEMENPQIQQGFVEGSNVNPVAEMVNMIRGMRAYEANSKAVQAQDQALDKAVNEVGRT